LNSPRNAISECRVVWLSMADVGDGSGEIVLSLLGMHAMHDAGEIMNALANNTSQDKPAEDLGPCLPRGQYKSVDALETLRPCLIQAC
jgi:hypothetical protein